MMDYLEKDVDDRYFLSDKMFAYVLDLEEKQQGTKWEGRANNDFINPKIAHTHCLLEELKVKGQVYQTLFQFQTLHLLKSLITKGNYMVEGQMILI